LLLVVLSGCAVPGPLGWELELADRNQRADAKVIEATVLAGGCSGEAIFEAQLREGARLEGMPLELAAGTWGFAGSARDEDCVVIAAGCTELETPATGPVVVMLETLAYDEPSCTATCDAGRCPPIAIADDAAGEVSP